MKSLKKYFLLSLTLMLCFGLLSTSCEAPAGADGIEGPRGEQGEAGPVGPAGEDGSQIYADEGEPDEGIGDIGDYYLNQNTGELHGPKDEDGWGSAIIVLMGKDGQDGADGEDGIDGSQIYSGSGDPDEGLGVEGDYYLDQESYGLYGPKTGSGWGTSLNLKGADGNANVTRYIFPGEDLTGRLGHNLYIPDIASEQEMQQSVWLVYFVSYDGYWYTYHTIPGYGSDLDTHYKTVSRNFFSNDSVRLYISIDGPGEEYDRFEVIRIEAGNEEDYRSKQPASLIPADLDVSDYKAVAEYYGLEK